MTCHGPRPSTSLDQFDFARGKANQFAESREGIAATTVSISGHGCHETGLLATPVTCTKRCRLSKPPNSHETNAITAIQQLSGLGSTPPPSTTRGTSADHTFGIGNCSEVAGLLCFSPSIWGKNQGRERRIDPHRQPAFQLGWAAYGACKVKGVESIRKCCILQYMPVACNSWSLTRLDIE